MESESLNRQKALAGRLDVNFALEAAGLGVWELDPVTNVVNWDDRCRELYGLAKDNLLSYEQAIRHIHPDDVNRVDEAVRQAMNPQSDGTYDVTYRTIGADDGRLRWVRFMGRAYLTEAGAVYRFAGVAQDVTERKKADEARRAAEQQARRLEQEQIRQLTIFDTVLAQLQEHVYVFDLAGRFRYVNKPLLNLWGLTFEQAIGKNVRELGYPPHLVSLHQTQIHYVIETAQPVKGEFDYVSPEGAAGQYEYTFVPLPADDGSVEAIGGHTRVVTEHRRAEQTQKESEAKFRQIIEEAPVATGLYAGRDLTIEVANDILLGYWGKDKSVLGRPYREAVPELEGQGFFELLENVFTTGNAYEAKAALAHVNVNGVGGDYYFNFSFKPLRNAAGDVYAILNMAVDVTAQVLAHRELVRQQTYLQNALAVADLGTFAIDAATYTGTYSENIRRWYGLPSTREPMETLMSRMHPDDLPRIQTVIGAALQSEARSHHDFVYRIIDPAGDVLHLRSFGKAQYKDGRPESVIGILQNVTPQIQSRQALEESELFARSVFDSSPVAKVVFMGEEMVIRTINQNMLKMLGRDASVIGRPFMEAIPELVTTPLMDRLRHVLATGETFVQPEERLDLLRYGQPYTGYYQYIYKALWNTAGERYGVIVTATEVTGQVLARQALEESEAILRGAIELSQLATWSLDVPSGQMTYSERFQQWSGADERTPMRVGFNPVHPTDQARIEAAVANALRLESGGHYAEEYTLVNQKTGEERIVQAWGSTYFDAQGKPLKLISITQDVTQQRQRQQLLEKQVQQRTEELAAVNEELRASNEEYAALNTQLEETNGLLRRSNENLQQFAYVASHDLQEPLRKIQSFGDLLKDQYADRLAGGVDYLSRMQSAAGRMSTLIKDLLSYSRISTQQDATSPVPLTAVLNAILTDLDLGIQETGAQVDVGPLPTVAGDASQLGQLFLNLLSNALKFRRPDVAPRIEVRSGRVSAAGLPATVRPARTADTYHRIDVTDNGIGFDNKYVDRIFQVFQRLHGKNQYAGTGIGLAICEKVATNHGGAITATSQPGQGATFSVYLPA